MNGLVARVLETRWGRILFSLGALWFLGLQVTNLVAPLLPSSNARFPWAMFSIPSGPSRDYRVYGIAADGRRIPIPVERWFRFRRGFSEHTLLFQHRALRPKPGVTRERRELARWLARRLYAEDGIRLKKVKLEYRYWPFQTHVMRIRTLATIDIRSSDYAGIRKLVY